MEKQYKAGSLTITTGMILMTVLIFTRAAAWGAESRASGFPLIINDVAGLEEPWPLIGGLPFPEGLLRDAGQIRIVDEQGLEVPAQIDVAATWRDGSIRWALAGLHADPRGNYRVEFGPDVSRSNPENPLVIERADGGLKVDTGAALFEFKDDELLPDRMVMDGVTVLENSGAGAYLVDNQGRLARVAGAPAEIETGLVKQGPVRVVIRREGWYVTDDGDRLARAKVWFYLTAGSPYLRVTHTLVFTEDTNDLWVRDYGLEFRTPDEPEEVVFIYREAEDFERMEARVGKHAFDNFTDDQKQAIANLLSVAKDWDWELFRVKPQGAEVYMLQDDFPHLLERDFRAVIGRGAAVITQQPSAGFWVEPWEKIIDVAGDWGDAAYRKHGLTVVLPWLAQQFPKEIAFGPQAARVALWSGRSARELDFRPVTLVREFWQEWATGIRGRDNVFAQRIEHIGGVEKISEWSNARGAARTHDIWLLPHSPAIAAPTLNARTRAAAHPPLLQADPQWLCATEAIGWPMHPQDKERFPQEEAVFSEFWDGLMRGYNQLRRTGFLEWGGAPLLRHALGPFYRIAMAADYGLRRNLWNLYVRSGDRSYLEFGTRFNRYLGDWEMCHWTAGEEYQGALTFRWGHERENAPLRWGDYNALFTLPTTYNWLLEHYLTGDEYVRDLMRMNAAALREHWDGENLWPHGLPSLDTVITAYTMDFDEELLRLLQPVTHALIDPDAPNGINDESQRFGALYKVDRKLVVLYNYYQATGDEKVRQAFLKAVDYKYRFHRMRGAFSGQAYPSFLFAIAYKWTGNPKYLRVVNDLLEQHRSGGGRTTIHTQMNPLFGTPMALAVIAEAEGPIDPFPVLLYNQDGEIVEILFRKEADRAVAMGLYLRLAQAEDADADPQVRVELDGKEVAIGLETEKAFRTHYETRRDMRGRHVRLTVPAQLPQGEYRLRFENAERVVLLDADAGDVRLGHDPESD